MRGIVESKIKNQKNLAQTASIPDQVVANLFNMLEKEGSPDQLASYFRPMIKRNNEAGNDIKKSLQELDSIINFARSLGVRSKIVVSPSFVYQPKNFSGMICQLVVKKKRGHDTLAAGGRYDGLINTFSSKLNYEEDSKFQPPGGVGMSICLDLLAANIQDEEIDPIIDVLIHSTSFGLSVVKQKLGMFGFACISTQINIFLFLFFVFYEYIIHIHSNLLELNLVNIEH